MTGRAQRAATRPRRLRNAPRRLRLSPEERREQLLDAAATLLIEEGVRALTMERLAERAGVSKGLGYAYFADAEAVAGALWDREVAAVYERVQAAAPAAGGFEERLRCAVGAYFDVVAERGALLGRLQALLTQARVGRESRRRLRAFLGFWARQLSDRFALDARTAETTAGMMLSAADACARSWQSGRVARAQAETLAVEFALGGVRAARRAVETHA